MNKINIKLSTKAKKAMNKISSQSNVPGIFTDNCEISMAKAIITKIPEYTTCHFLFISHTARISNNPDKNHKPSGRLNRNIYFHILSAAIGIGKLSKNEGFGKKLKSMILLLLKKI